ncbi:MAG: hypothetical protein K0U78_08440 [Actinomycetia bacterium]|nr:hypothetical protein [Actinomycetes bacterium]
MSIVVVADYPPARGLVSGDGWGVAPFAELPGNAPTSATVAPTAIPIFGKVISAEEPGWRFSVARGGGARSVGGCCD